MDSGSGPSSPAQARCVYTAASANRASQVVDWARLKEGYGELAYASNKSLVIARHVGSTHPPPAQLLPTPNAVLTVVKFAFSQSNRTEPKIVTASADGYLYLFARHTASPSGWRLQRQWIASKQKQEQQEQPQKSQQPRKPPHIPSRKAKAEAAPSVRALGVLRSGADTGEQNDHADGILFASATSDGMLQVWRVSQQDEVTQLQSHSLGQSRAGAQTEVLPLDIAIACLPGAYPSLIMAVAGTDSKIDVLLAEKGTVFRKLFSLPGHTDWVRSLDFCQAGTGQDACLMLASGSQDNGIRLWRIEELQEQARTRVQMPFEEKDEFERLAAQIEDEDDEAIATKMLAFRCGSKRWSISFDALLVGHEHWVTGIRWASSHEDGQQAALLSSSADNSVILWTPASAVGQAVTSIDLPLFPAKSSHHKQSKEQDIWVALHRFGELGNVGSAANGMYGVAWDPTAVPGGSSQAVLGHGYGGAIHIWSRTFEQNRLQPWAARPGLGGHFAQAMTARWEPGGRYLISGGADKTTRLHGCYRSDEQSSWHEVARPQTHGYEIVALAWLSRLAFASAGDEKVIRAFEAPQGFVRSAQGLSLVPVEEMPNVLAFSMPNLSHFSDSEHLTLPIKEATRRSLKKGRLDIVAVSPFFDGIEQGRPPQVSFKQAESFLKWCYAMAWSVAVEADQLLFDVDVILMGTDVAHAKLGSQRQADAFFIVEDASAQLPLDVPGAIVLPVGKPASGSTFVEPQDFPQHESIAMGGTFDHLHVGHKILLSMSCLLATRRVVVGVTGDSMLSKKKHASLLENTQERIDRVARYMAKFCNAIGRTAQKHDIVTLRDAAGPAGTDADLTALLFTDETVGGADFIDGEREKRGLEKLARFSIGVIGASGETDVKGESAGELAAAKVGSTAIRGWLEKRLENSSQAFVPPAPRLPSLDQVPALSGDRRPVGASVPPLGLSNRAIYDSSDGRKAEPQDGPSESGQPVGRAIRSIASHLSRPPVEEQLHNDSLWSEVAKLYGHSLELLALDVDIRSGLVASSCKANRTELAAIRIHDSRRSWKEVQALMGHELGVTRLRFSPNGQMLVSVSRDRSWRLFARKNSEGSSGEGEGRDGDNEPFELAAVGDQAHGRMIYDVAWCGNHQFVTVSRDGSAKIWQVQQDQKGAQCSATLSHNEPITAVAAHGGRLLAIGSEKGTVWLYSSSSSDGGGKEQIWKSILALDSLHADALSELAWQPNSDDRTNLLASAGHDGAIRMTEITI